MTRGGPQGRVITQQDPGDTLSIKRLDSISVSLLSSAFVPPSGLVAAELIPLVEWNWLRAAGHPLGQMSVSGQLVQLRDALRQNIEAWTMAGALSCGFLHIRRRHLDIEYAKWISFLRHFEIAIESAGFAGNFAKQVTGALGELEDNIHLHSRLARSGLILFLAENNRFEFVVVDRGIGVLASLRSAEEFARLEDEGEALEVALGDGNSRFGTAARRGYGFHDLFLGLANRNATLRFRSGDHLLELDGSSGVELKARRTQRANGRGFMIAVRLSL